MQLVPFAVRLGLGLALAASAVALAQVPPKSNRIPVLIVTGANNHEWQWTSRSLRERLLATGRFDVDLTLEPGRDLADAEKLARYRAVVLDYNGPRWGEAAETTFLELVRQGLGVVVVHAANNAFPDWVGYARVVGDTWREGATGHGEFHEFDVRVVDRTHPVTRNLPDLHRHPDELYHGLVRTQGTDHKVLATAHSAKERGGTGRDEPVLFAGTYGAGRVLHTTLGHVWPGVEATRASHEDPQLAELLARGTEWAATGEVRERDPSPAVGGLTPLERATGWRTLFGGTSTDAWRGFRQEGFPEQGWRVQMGALVCEGGQGGDLVTREEFGDFELALQWRATPKANSGVMYRVTEDAEATWSSGPEYQVLDDAALGEGGDPKHAAGALYDLVAPQGKELAPVGGFNQARIVVRGWEVEHWINGARVVQVDLGSEAGRALIAGSKFRDMPGFARAERGRIALQDHGDEVWYRGIKIRELPPPGQVALLDGKSLAGWTWHGEGEAEQAWSVSPEGELVCAGAPRGWLATERDFTDFVLELEWRYDEGAPEGANSGVLVRCAEEGDPWPRSLEAQLRLGNAGDLIRIGEFGGRGAADRSEGIRVRRIHDVERPAGAWNHMELVVQRGEVLLSVNGRLVNLLVATEQKRGPIALQSEGAPIRFRNVGVIPLDP